MFVFFVSRAVVAAHTATVAQILSRGWYTGVMGAAIFFGVDKGLDDGIDG